MAYLKKNIWTAFFIILLIGIFACSIAIKMNYDRVYEDTKLAQENIIKITANSVAASLRQYNVLLELVGNNLKQYRYPNKDENFQHHIDDFLSVDQSVSSLVLISLDGEVLHTDSNVSDRIESHLNLLETAETRDSFLSTLENNSIVVGRTYFSELVDTLVIPIRKTIRNGKGEPLFVASLVVSLEKGLPFLFGNQSVDDKYNVFVYREADRYFQIAPHRELYNPDIYKHQFPQSVVDRDIAFVEKLYGMSYEDIKAKGVITNFQNVNAEPQSLMSNYFIRDYGLWVGVETKVATLMVRFYDFVIYLIASLLIVMSIIYWLFRIIDRSEKRKNEQLTFQATHDFLTGLPNRFYLDERMTGLDKSRDFFLLFVDLDNFKSANDNYGHHVGDQILIEVAGRIEAVAKGLDALVSRYSGDEFIVIYYGADLSSVETLANRLLSSLREAYLVINQRIHLSASIGIAHYPFDGETVGDIKRSADFSLYESKISKNSYTIFQDDIKTKYLKHLAIESSINNAMQSGEFYVVFQPQYSSSGVIVGLEALLRWSSDKLGDISPDIFIPIVEYSGQMPKLGEFVIQQSLASSKDFIDQVDSPVTLSINVSAKQLAYDGFVESFIKLSTEAGFNMNRIIIEITESVFIDDVDSVIDILDKLRAQGVKVSLDDFGTGYSSLSLLKKLPIDELKIDKTFIDDLLSDSSSASMCENIISIANGMNIDVIAEGVETTSQKELLDALGCKRYQGYLFSKPKPISEIRTLR